MEITLSDVREFLSAYRESEDVQAFLTELLPEPKEAEVTANKVQEFLETPEGKELIQPIMDRRVDAALKTYRENHYDKDVKKAVAEEMLKRNPQETPEQRQIRELRERMEQSENARQKDLLRREIVEEAARQGIPSWWVDSFSGNTLEEAKVLMQQLKSHDDEVERRVREEILNNGHKPGSGDDSADHNVDLTNLSQDELVKLEMEGKLDELLVQQ